MVTDRAHGNDGAASSHDASRPDVAPQDARSPNLRCLELPRLEPMPLPKDTPGRMADILAGVCRTTASMACGLVACAAAGSHAYRLDGGGGHRLLVLRLGVVRAERSRPAALGGVLDAALAAERIEGEAAQEDNRKIGLRQAVARAHVRLLANTLAMPRCCG